MGWGLLALRSLLPDLSLSIPQKHHSHLFSPISRHCIPHFPGRVSRSLSSQSSSLALWLQKQTHCWDSCQENRMCWGVFGARGANWPTRRGFQDSRVAVIEHWLCVGCSLGPYMPVSLLVTVTTGRKVLPCSNGT